MTQKYLELIRTEFLTTKSLSIKSALFLNICVKRGDLTTIRYICQSGDVDNIAMEYILNEAIKFSNLEIAKYIIDCGCDLMKMTSSAVILAFTCKSKELLKYMYEKGVNGKGEFNGAFQILCMHNSPQSIKMFKEIGVPITEECAEIGLYQATSDSTDNDEICIYIMESYLGDFNPNKYLGTRGLGLNVVKYLHNKGGNLSNHQNAVFVGAIKNKDIPLIEYCVNNGVDVNMMNGYAVIKVAGMGDTEVLRALVGLGADVRVKADAAIIEAASNNNYDMMKLLYSYGCNVNHAIEALDEQGLDDMSDFITMIEELNILKTDVRDLTKNRIKNNKV